MAIDISNPTASAKALADLYVQNAQNLLKTQLQNVNAKSRALSDLQTALESFRTALTGLTSGGNLLQRSATFSDSSFGSATVGANAQPGTYNFFVERLATANQQAYSGLSGTAVGSGGSLTISLGNGTSFDVDIDAADLDGKGTVTAADLARAINTSPDAAGNVTASVVTTSDGKQTLILTAAETGASSQITVDASNVGDPALRSALGSSTELVKAQDAVIWLGAQGAGLRFEQASNTLTAIDGLDITFSKATAPGDSVTLKVANDVDATADKLKGFVDAYNALRKTIDDLTYAGDPTNGKSAGPLSADAGMRAFSNKLNDILRETVDGLHLYDAGIETSRDGTLSLDKDKLGDLLNRNPDALSTLLGDESSGLIGSFGTYLKSWLSTTDGQLKERQDSVTSAQKTLNDRKSDLDARYGKIYEQYLGQFTKLQTLDARMQQTLSILDNMFPTSTTK